jgi:outer membrane protein assembly factor BamA
LTAYGAYTFGSDALGWHNYFANLMWETSQNEAMGSFSYNYLNAHFFNFSRNLQARQWTGSKNNETTTIYDRETSAQWVSMLPCLRIERRLYLGIGAALQTTERVRIVGLTTKPQEERVAATFLRYDTRNTNWYADGYNRGNLSTLLYESYRPFNSYYDGYVTRFDTRQYLPLGETTLSARWTEARAHGVTEAFQLGGAADIETTQAPMLNQRNLPLRGYLGGEAVLTGQNARIASLEWRAPLSDIDRHAMTPPVGINRLSAAAFFDAGSVWNNGNARSRYYRSAGIELLGESIVYYRVPIPLRLGVARGLDAPGSTRIYLLVGQAF